MGVRSGTEKNAGYIKSLNNEERHKNSDTVIKKLNSSGNKYSSITEESQ